MNKQKKKIGQILLENGIIAQETLDKALEYQSKFGASITQYLIAQGYVNEEELARCITEQFKFPYLPLDVYLIPTDVINLVPIDIVKKHLIMPVDKVNDILTVVMADPFDTEAIEELEKSTDCVVLPFVGILSDIIRSIERYYDVVITDSDMKSVKGLPLFISTKHYEGSERRKAIRLKADIDIRFSIKNYFKKSKTVDISRTGLLFESDKPVKVDSYVTLQIDLPKEFSNYPIAAVVQVVRVSQLSRARFNIGVRIVKMLKEDINLVINHAKNIDKSWI